MNRHRFLNFPALLFTLTALLWMSSASSLDRAWAQEPTATPGPGSGGMFITVLGDEPFANVRLGPSASIYPVVGQLFPGDTAPALGRSPGGDWIQIEFAGAPDGKGWVYSPLVAVSPGTLKVAIPPPTPLPPPTATIDPTLAAQFTVLPTSTRLPTFTPAPPITPRSYATESSVSGYESVPATRASIIISLAGLGIFGLLLSFIVRR